MKKISDDEIQPAIVKDVKILESREIPLCEFPIELEITQAFATCPTKTLCTPTLQILGLGPVLSFSTDHEEYDLNVKENKIVFNNLIITLSKECDSLTVNDTEVALDDPMISYLDFSGSDLVGIV